MKESLLELLICPTCQGDLLLREGDRLGSEIITGNLFCSDCRSSYPILGGIPCFVTENIVRDARDRGELRSAVARLRSSG
jgi:uncharacterized protein YbaR (Trm112 family)